MTNVIWLAFFGALGTLSRYGVVLFVQKFFGGEHYWGTLVVNTLGCFVAGFLIAFFDRCIEPLMEYRVCSIVGFAGSFTTFSTYIADVSRLFNTGQYLRGFWILAIHNLLGFLFIFLVFLWQKHC
jgi:CrcB protein